MTLRFLRNKIVEVEPQQDGTLAVMWRLADDLQKMELRLRVEPPDLEIIDAEVILGGFVPTQWQAIPTLIKKIEGVRIGAGLRKITDGLLGGPSGCDLLSHAVLESSNAVILHYTRPGIEMREGVADDKKTALLRESLQFNPRLIRSCIAFQDDSPLMQGLNITEGK